MKRDHKTLPSYWFGFYAISSLVDYLIPNSIYIYIYIYIKSSTDRPVSFYQNSSVWLDILASRSWNRNPIQASTHQPRGNSSNEVNFKRLWITITIVYIHPLNGYRELNSYIWRALQQTLMATRLLHSLRELNPTGVGDYIYIYIYIWFVSERFVGDFILKWLVKAYLFIHKWFQVFLSNTIILFNISHLFINN